MRSLSRIVQRGFSKMYGYPKSHLYTINFLHHHKIDRKYYVCSRGIGDTAIFLSRLKAYHEKFGKKVNLIIAKNQEVLIDPYRDYINRTIVLKTSQINLLTQAIWDTRIYTSKLEFVLPAHAAKLLDAGNTLFGLTGKVLEVTGNDYDAPKFSALDVDSVLTEDLEQLKHAKYVFLAPDSVSVASIQRSTWEKIAQICREQGFIVVQNGKINAANRLGDMGVFKPIDETYVIAQNAHLIISARSGLSDLLAFTKTPMMVIYPDKKSLEEFTFSRMPFSAHVNEYIADDGLVEKMREMICQ